jgi:hypothetical protein
MQTVNEMIADSSSLLTSPVQPVKNGCMLTVLDAADSAQAVTLNQHSHSIEKYLPTGSQSFKESAFVETEGMLTGGAVIPSFNVAIDFDVFGIDFSNVSASNVIAPLLFNLHCTSPLIRRCANDSSKKAFPGLEDHYLNRLLTIFPVFSPLGGRL